MKKSSLFIITCTIATISFGQDVKESEIPEVVKAAFKKAYPTITNAKWEKEEANYEAEFDVNKIDNSVVLNGSGEILETEVEIHSTALPQAALDYLVKNHSGEKIAEAAKITDSKGLVKFEAEIKGKDIFFDANGNFIK